MGRLVTIATTNLNQWALDFEGNLRRVKQSIIEAKRRGAKYRVGPELEICGYGCLDHYLETDLYEHTMDMIFEIMNDRQLDDILIDIGAPIMHRSLRYNCRVILLNGRILLIRPKLYLANDGNYREMRYFTPALRKHLEELKLPAKLAALQKAKTVPIGDALLDFDDTCLGVETCEELFTPDAPHIEMGLNGAEIFSNASGSHHSLRKLDQRLGLMTEATSKNGGVYVYSNQQGMDGDRLYYDGCSSIILNSQIVARGSQFSLNDVEVISATVDLDRVAAHRYAPSRSLQAVQSIQTSPYPRITVPFALCSSDHQSTRIPTVSMKAQLHVPEEEIALGPAAWLWDYLRRSKQAGFLIPLSGGLDSCSTATLVFSMCRMVVQAIKAGNKQVIEDVQRIAGALHEDNWLPETPQELCNSLLYTVYMGMASQSSKETRDRAVKLSQAIGSYHVDLNIDTVFDAERNLLQTSNGFNPSWDVHGENLALQNIQARTRMVTAYYYAQMLPTVRKRKNGGSLLVLGSSNVDESLRGYFTKYDASSADINPIGSISKVDLKKFLAFAQVEFALPLLEEFLTATPTAELQPITDDYSQSDEVDMGMTYAELSVFGKLRKEEKLGPLGMFERLAEEWRDEYHVREIAIKVKRFFHFHFINRHKMTTLTPSYHAESYSPDDNRFDLRPFCYPGQWDGYAFKRIDEEVERLEGIQKEQGRGKESVEEGSRVEVQKP
jgi:NAD+ synthase (glutamine-hydrolysing)